MTLTDEQILARAAAIKAKRAKALAVARTLRWRAKKKAAKPKGQ